MYKRMKTYQLEIHQNYHMHSVTITTTRSNEINLNELLEDCLALQTKLKATKLSASPSTSTIISDIRKVLHELPESLSKSFTGNDNDNDNGDDDIEDFNENADITFTVSKLKELSEECHIWREEIKKIKISSTLSKSVSDLRDAVNELSRVMTKRREILKSFNVSQ